MVSPLLSAGAVVVSLSAAVVAASAVSVVRHVRARNRTPEESAALYEEKLRAYREILDAVVAFNRVAVELGEQRFTHEAEKIALEQESELDASYEDVHQAFESNFHVISPDVRNACSEFLDYPATYHEQGAALGELLSQAGEVFEAMRADLGVDTLYPDQS